MANLDIKIGSGERNPSGAITKWLQKNLTSEMKIDRFNKNLDVFIKDWSGVAAGLYTKRSAKDFSKLVTVQKLTDANIQNIFAGSVPRQLANISIKVENNTLASFSYDTHLGMVTEAGGSGKYRITRVAILQGQRKKVPTISDNNRSSKFAGAMGANVTPRHKGRIKGFVPKGSRGKIFIRLQPHTWKDGQRLPIAPMQGIPNAYLLNSNRTKTAFNFDQRLKDLWKR